MLTWSPFCNFVSVLETNPNQASHLSEAAKKKLATANSVLNTMCTRLIDGSIEIGQLQQILRNGQHDQFINLHMNNTMHECVGEGGKKMEKANLIVLLESRKEEVEEFEVQWKWNTCLLRMCRIVERVDCTELEQKLHEDKETLDLCQVCKPRSLHNVSQGTENPPDITYFNHTPDVTEMLQALYKIHDSHIFGRLWREQAEQSQEPLSLSEVNAQIWKPVMKQLQDIKGKLIYGQIVLRDVEDMFKDLRASDDWQELIEEELTKFINLKGGVDPAVTQERLQQIVAYYEMQQAADLAGVILKLRDAYELKGNFEREEQVCSLGMDEFKSRPLHTVDESTNIAEGNGRSYQQTVECLRPLVECKELVTWINEEIKDEMQLEVFADLAMNTTSDEMAMEIDRVSIFHRAASGYAPFIFELHPNTGYAELTVIAERVIIALQTDPALPTLLVDSQKELPWLQQVKQSKGDVEISSMMQVQAINARGVYTIGKVTSKTPGDKPGPTLELRVPPDPHQTRGRVYHSDELMDLQSKLTLVAGRAKGSMERQHEVDFFVEVFTAANHIAKIYEKLRHAGCILFTEWKAMLYSGEKKYSVHVSFDVGDVGLLTGNLPLLKELQFLREFMNTCLSEWYVYVDERRSRCYQLNYYSTEQLVQLRHLLAEFLIGGTNLPAQILVLLSAVKSGCTKADVCRAIEAAAKDVKRGPLDEATAEEQAEKADMEKGKQIVKKLMLEYGLQERSTWAAILELGYDKTPEEYMEWCLDNAQNDSHIESLTSGLFFLNDRDTTPDDDSDEGLSYPSLGRTSQEVRSRLISDIADRSPQDTLKLKLTQLWKEHREATTATNENDCLSLEYLGLILKHIEAKSGHLKRQFHDLLKAGEPNLLVCPEADIWMMVLSFFMIKNGPLPTPEEVLTCSQNTTLEEVVLLWRRAICDRQGRVFCLVSPDLLNYDISVKAERKLAELMCDQGPQDYRLILICSHEREGNCHIVAALDQYRRDIHINPRPDDIKGYLKKQLTAVWMNEGAVVTRRKSQVEVVVSSHPGVGKSLTIQRYTDTLARLFPSNDSDTQQHVTVPLFQGVVEKDAVVKALLPHQDANNGSVPMIYHLDVSPVVHDGLDDLLFNLLILRRLCDSYGQVWRCKPQDTYLVEITDINLQTSNMQMASSTNQQLYSLLPLVTCHAPTDVHTVTFFHHRLGLPRGWQSDDPKFDEQEFHSAAFQRAYQYLIRHSQRPEELDNYEFIEGEFEADNRLVLNTLLRFCGVDNPSWSELRHFAYFLSAQLEDCEKSVYCSAASGLQGFKAFVVKFLIQMARDFATPSLFMSEETPDMRVLEIEDDDEENDDETIDGIQQPAAAAQVLELFQLRRRWETSPHPYIFFNDDRVTMTFMGFFIDDGCSLVDHTTQQVIAPNIIDIGLKQVLELNLEQTGIPLNTDFDTLPRTTQLRQLGMVLGVEELIDPDETYELTSDNVMKMLAIHMRFRCGIPVVIMGETGCGKTRLIRFLCQLQGGIAAREGGLQNMILMKVHGGTTCEAIIRKIHMAQDIAQRNKLNHNVDTVLFLDEVNTTEFIGLIKEIMCDGRVKGQPIDMANGALKIVAACNPYRRHTPDMIERLKVAGLGYKVSAKDTQEKLGKIPLRELVYRVQALPPSMRPLVWDFGQLSAEVEAKYIRQIIARYVSSEKLRASREQADVINNVLSASQQFMREQKNECSFVSLRDVERCLDVMIWFHDHMTLLRPLLDRKNTSTRVVVPRDDVTLSLVLAIGVCYHACLQEGRPAYRDHVARAFTNPCYLFNGADQILEDITRCQDVFLDEVIHVDDNIAHNSALKENVFMMILCIELRIPLFLVGKPGSSKSLAKKIVGDAMQGPTSRSQLFKHLKKVRMTSYQCSPLSTPEGIVGVFKQCSEFQKGKDLDKFVSVVVLDEVGLAEDSPKMPLKTLHPLLETGSEEDEDEPEPYKKVAFIGLSNWALDPAKMNRGILVSREVPTSQELIDTARGICASDPLVINHLQLFIASFAEAYQELCQQGRDRDYFGLRDYYSLIKMVFHFSKQSKRSPTWAQIVYSVRRNFGGLPSEQDPVQVFEKHLAGLVTPDEVFPGDPVCTPAELLQASLDGHVDIHGSQSRYPLILTQNYAALPIIQSLLGDQDVITIFGSSFPYDQQYTQVCRNTNRIKVCMETGRTVILLNLESLYESLYDALNQSYVYLGDHRYVDLGLGYHRFKCKVHEDFRLIVIADKDVVYRDFPTPLINRLEKHFLATSTMLSMDQQEILKQVEKWVEDFASINLSHQVKYRYKITDAFIGYHADTLASLVFQVCHEMHQTEGDQEWKDMVCETVKDLMLQCATPDAVIRLGNSKLMREANHRFEQYFHTQNHSSLISFLQQELNQQKDELMVQVSTHSRLLAKADRHHLEADLQVSVDILHLKNFQTEHQFSTKIRDFYKKCEKVQSLLLVQCEDGHHSNNLIASASYCIQDERTQARERMRLKQADDAPCRLAHVVFIIQLSCGGKGFTGFQGSGVWRSVHIDDIHPAQLNRPEVSSLTGVDILNLFEQDPDIQTWMETDEDVNVKESLVDVTEEEPDDDGGGDDEDDDDEDDEEEEDTTDTSHPEEDAAYEEETRALQEVDTDVENQTQQDSVPHSPTCDLPTSHPGRHSERDPPNPSTIDVNCLIQDSLHTASARISDSGLDSERTTGRITTLMKLLTLECRREQGMISFLTITKQRLYELLKERQSRSGGGSASWLSREALTVADKHRTGTFRQTIWQHLIATISPLLAELVAYCDCNANLSLLLEHQPEHWQHKLWLAIFSSTTVVPVHYEDFISPTNLALREKALVRKVGTSKKSVTARLAFSYLLKEHLQVLHEQALELRGNSEEPIEVIFYRLVTKSPWFSLLQRFVPQQASQNFMRNYMIDFIRMMYKSSTYCDSELECVSCTLDLSLQLLARQLNMQQDNVISSLVLLHLAYANIQGTLARFARLVEVCPDLVNENNSKRLMKPDVTLDITAVMIAVESLQLDSTTWRENEGYRQDWLHRIQYTKPVIDNTIQAAMKAMESEEFGNGAADIVQRTRVMWDAMCVLKLFVEHVCLPSGNTGIELAPQALMLWMSLRNKPGGIKAIEGVEAVENVLSLCSKKVSDIYFETEIASCPICKKPVQIDPVQLPCKHICCMRCIQTWLQNNASHACPDCRAEIPEDYELPPPTESRESYQLFSSFRQRCNTFFMDVISQLCFADGAPPSRKVVEKLLSYVTKETQDESDVQQIHTKRITGFKDDSIDSTPVIRSMLLQLLLQSNMDGVQDYIDIYLERSQQVLAAHKPDNIVNVSSLFIHCMEDSYHSQAANHSNPDIGMVEQAISGLSAGREWLATKDPLQGLTVRFLIAIAKIRYGLVITANYLHQLKCVGNRKEEERLDMEQLTILFAEANQTCIAHHEAHLFLVRHLCSCYGSSTMDTLLQHADVDWIRPHELETQHDEIADRYVICGQAYGVVREAVAEAVTSGQFNLVTDALQKCQRLTVSQRETSLLLALFREVTMSYAREEERQIQPEMIDRLIEFLDESVDIRPKDFVKHMIRNHLQNLGCSQLVVSAQQGVLHQSVLALVMHTLITLICSPDNSMLHPLLRLFHRPEDMQRSYLPTMPEDVRLVARSAVRGRERVYECPNGHLYTVGDCGRPWVRRRCAERGCNEFIGGQHHEPAEGNRVADLSLRGHTLGDPDARSVRPTAEGQLYPMASCILRIILHSSMISAAIIKPQRYHSFLRGHTLGDPDARSVRPIAEGQLYPMASCILRIILHLSMISAAVIKPQEVEKLCHPPPPAGDIGAFLWQHLLKDLEQLSLACGKSQDDCLLIVHIVLQLITAEKRTGRRGEHWDELLGSRKARDDWEVAFAHRYLQPVIENLDRELARANTALQADQRFSANPLMRLLHQQPTMRALSQDDMQNLHTMPEVWQYRPQVTIESLQQYLERWKSPVDRGASLVGHEEDSLALLRKFLEKAHVLSVAQHLPDLLRLQQMLIDQFHRRIDATEADKITIEDFLANANRELKDAVGIFISVWNQVREDIFRHGGISAVPREFCFRVMDTTDSLAMLLPTDKQPGVCSTALVQFLINTHNEFMDFYHGLIGDKPRSDPIPACDIAVSHLVTFDLDKDLLPLMLAHKDYAVQADHGTTQTFNLMSLQRQIEERFVRGRPKLEEQTKRIVFRQELQNAAVFQKLRKNVPQKPLTIQHQILSQVKSVSDLGDCLAALDIAIGFLASTSSPPDVRISDYLHTTLSLPEDRGIKNVPKAHKYCRLCHILALWQTLAVERACRLHEDEQDPFVSVAPEYQHDLSNAQIAGLVKVRRHINLKHMLAELYEYMVLHLTNIGNEEQDITQYSIVDVLEAFMDEKDSNSMIHGLQENFPRDIQLQHAVHTWRTLVELAQP
ncbi:E3 ubiquitin-protein ligase rnf213-alpha-like [Amphiura filiformis]|uniref:E3 ubiquitin-protein ligase rnf213-alpha-like n=1 Tax=Amphiura filiformis TaxID=82378 RepID=UPI003B21B426